jgi:hypothetical protein
MVSVGWLAWLVLAVLLALLLTAWIGFTVTRLDRLHARVDATQAALDAQLVRRAAALAHVAETTAGQIPEDERHEFDRTAQQAIAAGRLNRAAAENEVGRALLRLARSPVELPAGTADELREAASRVQIARRFYNDAVRDTRALRSRRMPRLLHLAGHRELPQFFDIDDTLPPEPPVRRPSVTPGVGGSVPGGNASDPR